MSGWVKVSKCDDDDHVILEQQKISWLVWIDLFSVILTLDASRLSIARSETFMSNVIRLNKWQSHSDFFPTKKFWLIFKWNGRKTHGVWKSQKKAHSTLRAKRATSTFVGQKFIKNAKNGSTWRVLENLKLAVKQCYQTGQF